MTLAVLTAIAALVALTGCTSASRPTLDDERSPATTASRGQSAADPLTRSPTSATPASPAPGGSLIAQAVVPLVAVYEHPDAAAPIRRFENPWFVNDDARYPVDTVFLAQEQRNGWVRVLLPVRPNGSTGWVRATDVRLVPNRFRIEVDLGDHALTVYDGDQVLVRDTVAVGKPETPTPVGTFYLRVLLQAPDPTTVYGPYAYGLSSHSEALDEFNGGDAEIGIHGNNDPSLLGRSVSAGCIRMDNEKITRLAGLLPLGTPVEVRA
ncbi:MAG: hypothetical protein AMXMBFR46_22000 [Acidimicrobiia bacterium]